jgi:chemotaxis protein MotA
MNILAIISMMIASVVLYLGLRLATTDLSMFWDIPSLFIVFGGTFASAALSFQLDQVWAIAKIFFKKFFGRKKNKFNVVIKDLIRISDKFNRGEKIDILKSETKDFFILEALDLINDKVVHKDEIIEVMNLRNDNIVFNYQEDANKVKILGKYPPAFGMIGTTIGMIVLLGNLGGEDAMKMIGPAMGVCLITTFYGAALSNLILNPIADNLNDSAKEVYQKNSIVIEGIKSILEKKNPVVVAERINSLVLPSERVDWKSVLGVA